MLMDGATFQIFLAIAMLAVFALAIGSAALFRRGPGEHRQKAWLMAAAALVLFGNVLIWTV